MSDYPTTIDHQALEGLAAEYASALACHGALEEALRRRILDTVAELAPALREAAGSVRGCRDALAEAVAAAPGLFVRPKTRTVHGVKYGWQSGKSKIEIPDEAKTIKLIREHVDPAQQMLLILTKESVYKPAVLDLEARWLRKLGIRQVAGVDAPLVKAVADGVDKLAAVLLAELDRAEGPA